MFNPNRKKKMEYKSLTYSKEPIAMSSAKSIQKIKPTDLQSFKKIGGSGFFTGQMDNVQVYGFELTDAQVTGLFSLV